LVWLFMAGIASLAVIVVLIALVRHAWSVAKTAKRFQAEMAPLTEQLQTLSATAGERSSKIQGRSLGGPRTRPDG
jgi:uncharacterized protein YoxC